MRAFPFALQNRPAVMLPLALLVLTLAAGSLGYLIGQGSAAADRARILAEVGTMQAEINRINRLGERLVDMAGLDPAEFDFVNPPAMGGPERAHLRGRDVDQAAQDFAKVLANIDDRKRKLGLLETLIMDRDLKRHSTPDGWPLATAGVVTSGFGWRRSPFSGRRSMHRGVDIAARPGTDILAVADGEVSFAGRRGGYGNLVQIKHSSTMETRYAHNQVNLVREGERVRKGQVIARVGSTGRSTGPHLHFEVRRNGEALDPMGYLDMNERSRLARL